METTAPNTIARDCIRSRTEKTWSIEFPGDQVFPVIATRSADDMGLKNRGRGYPQQELLSVSVSNAHTFRVIDPSKVPELLAAEILQPIPSFAALSAEVYAPFSLYKIGDNTLLIDHDIGAYCLVPFTPADWPNPFATCQTYRGRLSAVSTFSADALLQLEMVVASMNEVTALVSACVEL